MLEAGAVARLGMGVVAWRLDSGGEGAVPKSVLEAEALPATHSSSSSSALITCKTKKRL